MEIKDVIWEKICQKEAELSELEYFYNNFYYSGTN